MCARLVLFGVIIIRRPAGKGLPLIELTMRTPILFPRFDATGRDTERALRLIRKIEERYGLLPVRANGDADGKADGKAAIPQPAAAQLSDEQMLVNEALVARIFQCERAETALRESQQSLHDLLIHQLQLKEEERKRVSQEIHDALGQNLLALRLDVASLAEVAGDSHPLLRSWVGSALDNIDSAIVTVRTLIAALRPFEIELGLEAAIEHELSQFRRTSGIASHLGMDRRVRDLHLSDEQIVTIYRALQECLSNILRHSRASRVDVILRALPATLTMVVSDNGVGIQLGSRGKPDGYGLRAMRERIASLGGKVSVKSVRSHGTSVSVSLPLLLPDTAVAPERADKMTT